MPRLSCHYEAPSSLGIRADFAELVDIGDDRELYATCRGEGSPTVVLISGTGGGADEWMVAVPDDDPWPLG